MTFFFFSSRRRHTRYWRDWSSDVCSSDLHFGENELSPGSIGFSPLNLPHPPTFQRRWVRTSTVSYHSFILDRLRSPGFASTLHDSRALFRLGFPSAPFFLTSP